MPNARRKDLCLDLRESREACLEIELSKEACRHGQALEKPTLAARPERMNKPARRMRNGRAPQPSNPIDDERIEDRDESEVQCPDLGRYCCARCAGIDVPEIPEGCPIARCACPDDGAEEPEAEPVDECRPVSWPLDLRPMHRPRHCP